MKLSRCSFLAAAGIGAVNVSLPDFVHAETSLNPENFLLIIETF